MHGTITPSAELLPESLSKLSFYNGAQIRPDPDFHKDMDRLISSLDKQLQEYQEDEQRRITEVQRKADEEEKRKAEKELQIQQAAEKQQQAQLESKSINKGDANIRSRNQYVYIAQMISAVAIAILFLIENSINHSDVSINWWNILLLVSIFIYIVSILMSFYMRESMKIKFLRWQRGISVLLPIFIFLIPIPGTTITFKFGLMSLSFGIVTVTGIITLVKLNQSHNL